ncbi:MAG: hypothetical protein AB8I08_20180 [Sandaracinaceae bacterium]
MRCWGPNGHGALGYEATGRCPTTTGSDLECSTTAEVVPGLTNVRAVGVGGDHVCAASDEGTRCWGTGEYGQLGTAAPDFCHAGVACSRSPVAPDDGEVYSALAAGTSVSCGLTADGEVRCW